MAATWAKLQDGSWGVRVQGTVTVGESVTVTKKDGTTKTARIARIVWQGQGVCLCAVESARPEPTTLSGETAIRGRHWSQRDRGPEVRLCAGGCGRRVGPRYAQCYACAQEELEAM